MILDAKVRQPFEHVAKLLLLSRRTAVLHGAQCSAAENLARAALYCSAHAQHSERTQTESSRADRAERRAQSKRNTTRGAHPKLSALSSSVLHRASALPLPLLALR